MGMLDQSDILILQPHSPTDLSTQLGNVEVQFQTIVQVRGGLLCRLLIDGK